MTYRELLQRLADLRALAAAVPHQERSGCMSSFDRASKYDPQTDTYICWGANDDGTGCIRRMEDGGIVAFESEGPGVIWRVWSALPQQGHMRVYVDGEEKPCVDVPFIDWFEKQPDEVPPLNLPELSTRLSRGRNSFIPIPFKKSCRIELAEGWGAYYHFTYTLFAPDTVVPAYTERFTRDGMIALAQMDRLLYDRGDLDVPKSVSVSAFVKAGDNALMLERSGSGAIAEMMFYPEELTDIRQTLRTLMLRVYWDGRKRPAIEAPVGDFYGGAPGYARYRCLPMSMERGVFTCRFYMPFAAGCRVEIVNMGRQVQKVRMAFSLEDAPKMNGEPLRFHAKWHRGYDGGLDTARFAPSGDRWPDWPLLLVHGVKGRYCGVHLHVYNVWRAPQTSATSWWYGKWDQKSVDWWWGEGDEKFFVDGERFPSTFGTGSEDYIGYAWAAEPPFARFDSAFACMNAMPIDGNGHTSVSRFHVADSIPFQESFEGFIEKYKEDRWADTNRCLYAATPYWYQQAETDDAYPPLTAGELLDGYDGLEESGL